MSDPYNQYSSYSPAQGGPGYPPQNNTCQDVRPYEGGAPENLGPPAAGGFQPAYDGGQLGPYDTSNPQGDLAYDGQPPNDRAYTHSHSPNPPYDSRNPYGQQVGEGAAADPNAAEGERGLGSSLAGGAAGYYLGHKKDHGLLGAVGGALLGNYLGDKIKDRKDDDRKDDGHKHGHGHGHHHDHHHHSHHHHGSHSGHSSSSQHGSHSDSSWGGRW